MMHTTHVLIIDDDASYPVLTRRILSRTDQTFVVDWVDNYDDGLQRLREAAHDVYLLDYNLGSADGLELLQQARADGFNGPVILMTSNTKHDHALNVRALQAGATDYIDKVDITPQLLQRAIQQAIARSRIEADVRENEMLYRALIAESPDGIAVTDVGGRLTIVNQSLCDLTGYSADELIGQPISRILSGFSTPSNLSDHGDGMLTQARLSCRYLPPRDVDVSARRTRDRRVQFVVRDISERQRLLQSQARHIERLQILGQVDEELNQRLELSFVLTMALDAAMRLSAARSGLIALVDAKDDVALDVQHVVGDFGIHHPADYMPHMTLIYDVLRQKRGCFVADVGTVDNYTAVTARANACMIMPLQSYEKQVGVMVLEGNRSPDFTRETFDFVGLVANRVAVAIEHAQLYRNEKQRYAELEKLYEQVSQLEHIKTMMIRVAAHDIRNPLTVILNYVDLIRMMPDAPHDKIMGYVDLIERAANHVSTITHDILSLEQLESLQADDDSRANVSAALRDVLDKLGDQATQKELDLQVNTPQRDLWVRGVQTYLTQAVANLVSNAIKYTPRGGHIKIKLTHDDGWATFKVIDDGAGIPSEKQKKLFTPFYRAISDGQRGIDGTGLGLYLVKSIIEGFGGDIIFHSVPDEGCTFGFWLPLWAMY